MRIINELNKISSKILGDPNPSASGSGSGYYGGSPAPYSAPGPGYPHPHPQHSFTYPPPAGYGSLPPGAPLGSNGPMSPAAPSPIPSHNAPSHIPHAPHSHGAPQHQGTWPPPPSSFGGAQPPVYGAPQQLPPYSPPEPYSAAPFAPLASPPVPLASPPQTYASPPQTYASAPFSPQQTFSAPSQSQSTNLSYPFSAPSATPQLSPATSSAYAPSPQTPHAASNFVLHAPDHAPSAPSTFASPAAAPIPGAAPADPANWVDSLNAILPTTLQAASEYVRGAHTHIDTIWLYFVDLGAGVYFADAVYGIDGNAFMKDDLAWAGVKAAPEAANALYRVLAGEWLTKICLRSKVEEVHPARVVVRYNVADESFGSTFHYEVAEVRHPRLSPALVLREWVARLKATGEDSATFHPSV